jgi:hypothetical protein
MMTDNRSATDLVFIGNSALGYTFQLVVKLSLFAASKEALFANGMLGCA